MRLLTVPKVMLTIAGISPPEWFDSNLRTFYQLYRSFTTTFYFAFFVCLALQLVTLMGTEQTPDRVSGSVALVVTAWLLITKVIIYKTNNVLQICHSVEEGEKELCVLDDPEIQKSYKGFLRFSLYMNCGVVFPTGFAIFACLIVPLFELRKVGAKGWDFQEKAFMFDMYFPFDKNSHFVWVIVVNVYAGFLSFFVTVSCQTTLYALIVFGIFQLKRLQIRLKNFHIYVEEFNNGDVELTIKRFIQEHQSVAKYIENLNNATKYVILLEFVLNSFNAASVLFQVITVPSLIELTYPLFFFFLVAMEILFIGWTSNEIKEQSIGIADALYESPWYEHNEYVKKLLHIMILRSQKPLILTIGPFAPVTTETVIMMMKACYSYIALMKNSYDKNGSGLQH